MFRFGFTVDDDTKEKTNNNEKLSLDWISASEVDVPLLQYERIFETEEYMESSAFPDLKLKLIRSDKVMEDLIKDNCQSIVEAESQHSDLIPAKYEGGLKIWECSYDLGKYILENNINLKDKWILDLGCGTGIIGLIALLKGSMQVHFQDYNVEVIKSVTIPNVLLNLQYRQMIRKNCKFYFGDWESFNMLFSTENIHSKKYDFIFTSETIYNPTNQKKLYEVFKNRLKQNGIGFVAGKTYYFGVGGDMRQFENLIHKDALFNTEVIWKSHSGLQKEILKLSWR